MAKYSQTHVDLTAPRTELHDALGLTAAEISINNLPAGGAVPFVHSHKHNEEIYLVLEGTGRVWVDGEVHELKAGDCFHVATGAGRAIKSDTGLRFICVQARENSLKEYTSTDGELVKPDNGPEWLK